jgi:hypothetical protein
VYVKVNARTCPYYFYVPAEAEPVPYGNHADALQFKNRASLGNAISLDEDNEERENAQGNQHQLEGMPPALTPFKSIFDF